MKEIQELVLSARSVSTPLIGVETSDPAATIAAISEAVVNEEEGGDKVPQIEWDIIRGLVGRNQIGQKVVANLAPPEVDIAAISQNPSEALALLPKVPEQTIVYFHNAQRYLNPQLPGSEAVAQGIWNLRDQFKSTFRTLILPSPMLRPPDELAQDIIVFSEPLPDDEKLGEIVDTVYAAADLEAPSNRKKADTIFALRGLAAFPAEQVTAMCLTEEGVDLDDVWDRKRTMIEQTRGLAFLPRRFTLNDVGGLDQIKKFSKPLFAGEYPPTTVLFIDEIEKMFAGAFGGVADSSGVSQDQLGVMLRAMEDNNWSGCIFVGPPGTAKSMVAQAMGNTYGKPVIAMDLGAVKGSLVGQSEAQMRGMMKTVYGIGGDGVFIVATCNRLESLPPELRRRFKYGIWYFDIPSEDERKPIWKLNLKRYNLKNSTLPNDHNWTGAEIRNVCELSWRLGISLEEASNYIVPVMKSDPEAVNRLRKMADGKFLSASYEGTYVRLDVEKSTKKGRKIRVKGPKTRQ